MRYPIPLYMYTLCDTDNGSRLEPLREGQEVKLSSTCIELSVEVVVGGELGPQDGHDVLLVRKDRHQSYRTGLSLIQCSLRLPWTPSEK